MCDSVLHLSLAEVVFHFMVGVGVRKLFQQRVAHVAPALVKPYTVWQSRLRHQGHVPFRNHAAVSHEHALLDRLLPHGMSSTFADIATDHGRRCGLAYTAHRDKLLRRPDFEVNGWIKSKLVK